MSLEGRVALVTGASRGIGRAIAVGLAADGADVVVNYRKDEGAAEETVAAVREQGREAMAIQADVSSWDQVKAMVDGVVERFDHVDLLVNNAGLSNRGGRVSDTELSDLERVMGTMALGSHHVCQLVLPSMRTRPRADIVFVSSQSAVQHNPYAAPYNMAKSAQESLAYTLAQEEARNGIRVNIVSAGLVNTDMGRKVAKAAAGADDIHDLDTQFGLGRVNEPEDIAGVVRFLVSETAAQVTGQRLAVDAGGMG